MSLAIRFANTHAPDRIVAVGVLALRPLRYVAEGLPPEVPAIEDLRVEAVGCAERPVWHASTGLYGFLALPPGPCRIQVSDPLRRWLPAAYGATVPDRAAVKRGLELGLAAPTMAPRPLLRDVALRPAPGRALSPGISAIRGVVRIGANGPAVPLARLAVTALVGSALRSVVTYSAWDGSYVLTLPGECPDAIGGAPPFRVERALVVHAPKPPLAAALAADPLAGLPAEIDDIVPDAPTSPFGRRGFVLRAPDGTLRSGIGGADPTLEILGGQQRRWDIELT